MNIKPLPQPGTLWKHYAGKIYRVLMIANANNPRADRPVTVVFESVVNQNVWTREADDWHRSFTEYVPDYGTIELSAALIARDVPQLYGRITRAAR